MKNYILLFALIAMLAACKDEKKDFCNNGIADYPAGETEIDCGGPCEPCPPAEALTATYDGFSYIATSISGSGSGSTIDIYTQGTSGFSIGFTFVGTDLNVSLPVTNADASGYGTSGYESYEFKLTDSGTVTLTANDTRRKIMSGTFSFSLTDYYGSGPKKFVQNGVFSNVRYSN